MTSQTTLLDPTAELKPSTRQLLPRLATIDGATIGLLDISKPRGKEFLDEIESQLVGMGATVHRYSKPTFARIAPTELNQKISVECDAVIAFVFQVRRIFFSEKQANFFAKLQFLGGQIYIHISALLVSGPAHHSGACCGAQ